MTIDATSAAANRAGLFALMTELAATGTLPRESAGRVLDAMFDTVLQAGLSTADEMVLLEAMRSDWSAIGKRV